MRWEDRVGKDGGQDDYWVRNGVGMGKKWEGGYGVRNGLGMGKKWKGGYEFEEKEKKG